MSDRTVYVGHVHVLTHPGGPCWEHCPHPDHSDPKEVGRG